MNAKNLFTDTDSTPYAELPVKPAFLRWTRGDAKLSALKDSDPALFFGGWKAMVKDNEGNARPSLPLPVVKRVSEDGLKTYEVYASNVIEFLPIAHRTRFELRVRETDPNTGREKSVIKSVSKARRPGYAPHKQVFGLVFVGESYAPAVLILDKWSSFITYERAAQRWAKVKASGDKVLIRRYGTVGEKGNPKFDVYGESRSTPIEAVGVDKPRFVEPTEEMTKLAYDAIEWANCPRWNAEGDVVESPEEASAKDEFLKLAETMGYTNIDIENELAAAGGSYVAALKNLSGGFLTDPNAELEAAETNPY